MHTLSRSALSSGVFSSSAVAVAVVAALATVTVAVAAERKPVEAPSTGLDFSVHKDGDPLASLPAGTRMISTFGERPVFSPDGTRIAFIGKSYGDAFEYDLTTGKVRNLTAHSPNAGFLRVHYLSDGNLLLLGPRRLDADRQAMRISKIELWYLDKAEGSVIQPLHQTVAEGLAISPTSNRIGWAALDPLHSAPGDTRTEYTALKTGEVVVRNGVPELANVRELVRKPTSECVLEAQDFRANDGEMIAACYDVGGARLSLGKFVKIEHSSIHGVRMSDGAMSTYLDIRDGTFAEPEGIAPSGKWMMVECGPGEGAGLDLCRLELKPGGGGRLSRLTRVLDYGPHRVSNPVISSDGKRIAFQFGRAGDEAGVGMGILVMPMPAGVEAK